MTNPKSRKSRHSADHCKSATNEGHVGTGLNVDRGVGDEENVCTTPTWNQRRVLQHNERDYASVDEFPTPTPDSEDLDEEDEVSPDTLSSFSLQECLNEMNARRIRRSSAHNRDLGGQKLLPADEELIKQNRSNKEQEKKCKPCEGGNCYCFTSDSGDAMGGAHEASTARKLRRSRKSESSQHSQGGPQHSMSQSQQQRRQSAPAGLKDQPQLQVRKSVANTDKSPHKRPQLTAVSRLETSTRDAPLIHIIQELRSNCVISEVRVNKQKMQAAQRSRSLGAKQMPRKTHFNLEQTTAEAAVADNKHKLLPATKAHAPSAPTLDKISELDSQQSEAFIYSTSLDSSAQSNDSPRRRHKAAGRLLQKRLSQTQIQFKPRNHSEPPRKPPRCSVNQIDDMQSVSSLASTSPSMQEANRVVDDFLRSKGCAVPGMDDGRVRAEKQHKERHNAKTKLQQPIAKDALRADKRKSYPMTKTKQKAHFDQPLPTCPSLSDLERLVPPKIRTSYQKNIRHAIEKPIKQHSFGWKEPSEHKIRDMLNYDANVNQRKFKSQAVQAEPQTIGWRMPPKLNLDTVDGEVGNNLAANMSTKNTPVKTRLPLSNGNAEESQKFIFREQLKNLVNSPWSNNKSSAQQKPKSSLKSTSRSFLNNSKKKILKLVSPKKENRQQRSEPFDARQTPLRSIGVQTSKEDLPYELSSTPQSPPGSYFSAVQTSQQSTTPTSTQQTESQTQFDFNRTVQSPPKKSKVATHRKLNFPLNTGTSGAPPMTKTYCSFHSDLDQDVTLSKMGCILSNIRAKLEASDDHAVRTFQEIERREQLFAGTDCIDGPHRRHLTRIHGRRERPVAIVETVHDPIYSEIEEDSIHVCSGPQFENNTGIQHFQAEMDPTALYAKVMKSPKKMSTQHVLPTTALAKCMHDSLKDQSAQRSTAQTVDNETTTRAREAAQHSQSLNNIRVMEQHSPPKYNRNLSKSDLSLQRSEIFLENLCRSEIIVDAGGDLERLEKVPNLNREPSYTSFEQRSSASMAAFDLNQVVAEDCYDDDEDVVSYELPDGDEAAYLCHTAADSHLGLSHIEPPHSTNQSTPKKSTKPQTFMTKYSDDETSPDICVDLIPGSPLQLNQSNSCPTTPRQVPLVPAVSDHACATSLIEVSTRGQSSRANSTLARYQRLKNALRKSLRKSKHFVKLETKRLSTSLSFPLSVAQTSEQQSECGRETPTSNFDLDRLFSLEADEPLAQQLAKAVTICRQLPDLEISTEMVEAERLLLFSTLKRDALKIPIGSNSLRQKQIAHFYVDAMRLPIRSDASQDLFFNYFYIGAFQCGGVIRSTQSVECLNHEAVFRNCGLEFSCSGEDLTEGGAVTCDIFMLRLRKVSTLSLEPKKSPYPKMSNLLKSGSSHSSSSEEIVSRFRLHGTFTLEAGDFVPYEYVDAESTLTDRICLRSSAVCKVDVTPRAKSSNLPTEVQLTGRAELRLPKSRHCGFLNVQDPQSQHSWNRRWCTLDGLYVHVWQDVNDVNVAAALQQFDMRHIFGLAPATPLQCASRELCARPRSFSLCSSHVDDTAGKTIMPTLVFFSAESQSDLNQWLLKLNEVLEFVGKWIS